MILYSLNLPVFLQFCLLIVAKLASINQSGSLSLFSSKEIELEQRALLLKRLAFVIYCSNEDQYQKQVPDIQGIYIHLDFLYQRFVRKTFAGRLISFMTHFREISWKLTNDSKFSSRAKRSISMLSGDPDSYVSTTCHIIMAINNHRNGGYIFISWTRAFYRFWRMDVSLLF